MFTCSSCHYFFMLTVSLQFLSLNLQYIRSRFKSDSNISLCFFICTDTIWSTLEGCWEWTGFLFWCGAATTFPVFDVLVVVIFISSPLCSSSGSDDTRCFLIFSFNNFGFDDKDAKKLLPCRHWSLMLHFLDSSHFLNLHQNYPYRKHWLMQLLVQYLH